MSDASSASVSGNTTTNHVLCSELCQDTCGTFALRYAHPCSGTALYVERQLKTLTWLSGSPHTKVDSV